MAFLKFQFDKNVEVLQKEMQTHVHTPFIAGTHVTYPSGGALYFSKVMRSHTICVCNFPPLTCCICHSFHSYRFTHPGTLKLSVKPEAFLYVTSSSDTVVCLVCIYLLPRVDVHCPLKY